MLWTVGGFYLNQPYIAKVLCENRDKPQSGCNGVCQLKKKLKQDQEDQESSAGADAKHKELKIIAGAPAAFPITGLPEHLPSRSFYHYDVFLSPQDFTLSVFHPPAAFRC